ncbi:MAG: SBBP repeat-containing protein [Clostridia bacterium]|nr:SBBP repeat-containing protein [Clostridia bacterium]
MRSHDTITYFRSVIFDSNGNSIYVMGVSSCL